MNPASVCARSATTEGTVPIFLQPQEIAPGKAPGKSPGTPAVGEDHVVNTELRFPDEFVRHKILDIIGDLYLLGSPLRGRVHAQLTGHRDNIALVRKLVAENTLTSDS